MTDTIQLIENGHKGEDHIQLTYAEYSKYELLMDWVKPISISL